MKTAARRSIYTIGHSTHTMAEFLEELRSFDIQLLVDIRRFPGSRRLPWFDKEELRTALEEQGMAYVHLEDLGGRRKVQKGSKNDHWRNASFRGYADYMETGAFGRAIASLEAMAMERTTAYMCAEAVWWRCHRALVSDYLKAKGWTVWHIMAPGKVQEHPYTSAARVSAGHVYYYDEDLFTAKTTDHGNDV